MSVVWHLLSVTGPVVKKGIKLQVNSQFVVNVSKLDCIKHRQLYLKDFFTEQCFPTAVTMKEI